MNKAEIISLSILILMIVFITGAIFSTNAINRTFLASCEIFTILIAFKIAAK
jgi:hypothetical protein